MLQKASQIQEQLSEYKEQIRRKRLLMQYQQCSQCHTNIEYSHEIIRDMEAQSLHVREHGHCPQCKGQIPSRQFTAH